MTIYKGRTVMEAIATALDYLNVKRDNVEVKIIQEGRNGFLGIGKKPAIVDVTELESNLKVDTLVNSPMKDSLKVVDVDKLVKELQAYLTSVIEKMGFEPQLVAEVQHTKDIYIDIVVQERSRLIGHHGKTINALQGLGQIFINRSGGKNINLILDSANYRTKRRDALIQLADKTARNAIANGKPIYLNPMNANERKIIHNSLKTNQHVTSYSTGKEPRRVIVVVPR